MESSHFIRDGFLHMEIRGQVTVDELIAFIKTCRRDAAFREGMSSVCDMREAHGHWDFSETQRYRDFVVHIAGGHKRRWANVVRPGQLAAMFHVIILISEQASDYIQMQVFEEHEPALRWAKQGFQPEGQPECNASISADA